MSAPFSPAGKNDSADDGCIMISGKSSVSTALEIRLFVLDNYEDDTIDIIKVVTHVVVF